MQPSIIGLLVAGAIFLIDRRLRGHLVVGLIVSLAFGATAFAVLTALGGSSPLIYVLFAFALGVSVVLKRDFFSSMRGALGAHPIGWIIILMVVYVIAGGYILPRLFAGETMVFVVQRGESGVGGVVPKLLAPSNFNISQAGYFAVSAVCYLLILSVAMGPGGLRCVKFAALGGAIAVAATGYVDLLGKLAGLGDILAPIRTANYSMLTAETFTIAGIPRISGAFSEAAAFASAAVPAFAFSITYWRMSDRTGPLILALLLLVLVVFSTSTTAYATLGVFAAGMCVTIGLRILTARVKTKDTILFLLALAVLTALFAAYLYDSRIFQSFFEMIDMMLLRKLESHSAYERGMWNVVAFQGFLDTYGFGIGVGSTRSSSWVVAVLSNLGWIGAGCMFATLFVLVRGLHGLEILPEHRQIAAISRSCRAAALTSLVAETIAGPNPDPGVYYYFALATVVATRHYIASDQRFLARHVVSSTKPGPATEASPHPI